MIKASSADLHPATTAAMRVSLSLLPNTSASLALLVDDDEEEEEEDDDDSSSFLDACFDFKLCFFTTLVLKPPLMFMSMASK